MKNVLLIAANGLSKTGVPTYIMNIVRNLSNVYCFDIVTFNDDDYYKKEFLSYGGNIYNFKHKKVNNKFLN